MTNRLATFSSMLACSLTLLAFSALGGARVTSAEHPHEKRSPRDADCGVCAMAPKCDSLSRTLRSRHTQPQVASILRSLNHGFLPATGTADRDGWHNATFAGRFREVSTYFGTHGVSLVARVEERNQKQVRESDGGLEPMLDRLLRRTVSLSRIDLSFPGGNPSTELTGESRLDGMVTRATGGTGQEVRCDHPWQSLRYRELYPNIDLVFHSAPDGLKYEFIVRPGGDPSMIRIALDGATASGTLPDGRIRFANELGEIRDRAPLAWSIGTEGDSTDVDIRYRLTGNGYGFVLDRYDTTRTLVIDPFLQWSSYYGGSMSDYAQDVAIDAEDNIYISGYTSSSDFPLSPGCYQDVIGGSMDAFVMKLGSSHERLWATFIGGTGEEEIRHLAVTRQGGVVLAGSTSSTDFPVTRDGFQSTNNGKNDAFVARFDPNGKPLWATYLGGGFSEECLGIALDSKGDIIITGATYSTNFPVTKGAFQVNSAGEYDAFIAKLSMAGKRIWATYYGGWGVDYASAVAIDNADNIILTGYTESLNFPVTPSAYQGRFNGGKYDAFLAKFNAAGTRQWSTYVGGNKEDRAMEVAIDNTGTIVISGYTESANFPVSDGAFQTAYTGLIDGFVTAVTASGGLAWSTFLGGSNLDIPTSHTIDPADNVMVIGYSESTNFPVTEDAFQLSKNEGYDVFISRLNSKGQMTWSSYYGGEDQDLAYGVASDSRGSITIVGATSSARLGLTGPRLQEAKSGFTDVFLLRIVYQMPQANAGPDTTICFGSTAIIGKAATGGKPPYEYAWQPAETVSPANVQSPFAQPSATTSYIVRVTDAEGIRAFDTVTVYVRDLPSVDAGATRIACFGEPVQLEARASGGSQPYTYMWSPDVNISMENTVSPTVIPPLSTTYKVIVTDAYGCTAADSVTVVVNPRLTANAGPDVSICTGSYRMIGGEASGGTPPFRYAWMPREYLSASDVAQPTAFPRETTTFIVTVTDALNCTSVDSVIVEVLTPPTASLGADLILCHGDVAQLVCTASGGKPPYRYAWNPRPQPGHPAVNEALVRPGETSTYSVTVTDAVGCEGTDSITVFVRMLPEANAGPDMKLCIGTAVNIGVEASGGSPPYKYSWMPSTGLNATYIASPVVNPTANTMYVVSVTDAEGCTDLDTVFVRVFEAPSLKIDPDFSICRGSRKRIGVSVKGGKGPYVYDWSPKLWMNNYNTASPTARPDSSITYTVVVVDANGCRAEASVNVTVRPCSRSDAGPDLDVCGGVPVTIGGVEADPLLKPRYAWTPTTGLSSARVARPILTSESSGQYVLTVTNIYGCEDRDTVDITVHPVPVADPGPSIAICEGTAVTIGRIATGGTPPYQYRWEPVDGLSASDIAQPVARPERTTTYKLTVIDSRGCADTKTVDVAVKPMPMASAGTDRILCSGSAAVIGAKSISGSPPISYTWMPATGLNNPSLATPTASPVLPTAYTLTVTTADGCQDVDTIIVDVQPLPNPVVIASTVDAASGLGEPAAGAASKRRIGTDSPPISICSDQDLVLESEGEFARYAWSDGSTSKSIRVVRSGVYTLRATDGNGCTAKSSPVIVEVNPVPVAKIVASGPTTFCEGESVTLDAGRGHARYLWSTGATERTITVNAAGRYSVSVTSASGCTAEASPVELRVLPSPVAVIERRGDTLVSSESARYQWLRNRRPIRGATLRSYVPSESGSYAVVQRSEGGCIRQSETATVAFGSATIAVGVVTAARIGDTIDIPVQIRAATDLDESNATDFVLQIRFKKKSLTPLLPPEAILEIGEDVNVTISGKRRAGDRRLTSFRAVVLEPTRRIPVRLANCVWLNGQVTTRLSDGEIRVRR